MSRSTRLRLAVCPSARKVAGTRGAPYRPRCAAGTRRISHKQGTVDRLPMALAAAPSVIPRRRGAQYIAHGANREGRAPIFDKTHERRGASEKMRRVFLESPAP